MQINKEKRQALVEFLTPDDATKALTFDGRLLLGSVLKIRRPKDYIEKPVRHFKNSCYVL
jgi:splicing factor U2AF 65 kDa subunit